jgi:hypothetical protein
LSIFDARRLQNWHRRFGERLFNRRRLDFLFAPDRFVWLGDEPNDFVLGFSERLKCRHTDFARADKNNAHAEAIASIELAQSGRDFAQRLLAQSICHPQ